MKQQVRYMLETLDSIIVGYTSAIRIVHLEIQNNYKLCFICCSMFLIIRITSGTNISKLITYNVLWTRQFLKLIWFEFNNYDFIFSTIKLREWNLSEDMFLNCLDIFWKFQNRNLIFKAQSIKLILDTSSPKCKLIIFHLIVSVIPAFLIIIDFSI